MDTRSGMFEGLKDSLISIGLFVIGLLAPPLDFWLTGRITDPGIVAACLAAASIATIWIAGSAMAKTESWQTQVLKHGTMSLFGTFAATLVLAAISGQAVTWLTLIFSVTAVMTVFRAFWSTGVQSRAYYFELFEKLGYAAELRNVAHIVGTLNGPRVRRHDVAHQLIGAVLDDGIEDTLEGDFWRELTSHVLKGTRGGHEARLKRRLDAARAELEEYIRAASSRGLRPVDREVDEA